MFCHKCGSQLPEEARFCQKCGTKVVYKDIERETSDSLTTSRKSQDFRMKYQPSPKGGSEYFQNSDIGQLNNTGVPQTDKPIISERTQSKTQNSSSKRLKKRKHVPELVGIALVGIVVSSILNSETENPSSSSVNSSEIYTNEIEDNAREEVDDNNASNIEIDKALCGRWRAYDGNVIELSEDGTADTSLTFPPSSYAGNPVYITWSASNGQLILNPYFYHQCTYKVVSREELRFNDAISMYRKEGTTGDGLLGEWMDFWTSTYAFYEDGTGIWNNMHSTWEADNGNLSVYYSLECSYDYYITGDVLDLFFSDGSISFLKVSN